MDQDLSCRICGRPASRVHYSTVLACGSCKEFYRRAVRGKVRYYCNTGNCSTDANNQRRCKACRFRKCLAAGMRSRGLTVQETSRTECAVVHVVGEKSVACWTSPDTGSNLLPGNNSDDIPSDCSRSSNQRYSSSPELTNCTDGRTVPGSTGRWKGDRTAKRVYSEDPLLPQDSVVDTIFPFIDCRTIVDKSRQKLAETLSAVVAAARMVFGDQVSTWRECNDTTLRSGPTLQAYVEATAAQIIATFRHHNVDYQGRILRFASVLPGTCDLELSILKDCTETSWKPLVFWTVYHAHFMTEDSLIVLGPSKLRCNQHTMRAILQADVCDVMDDFTDKFRDIGLTQIERYLLLLVVMFELDDGAHSDRVRYLHRHYASVLLDALKFRCSGGDHFQSVCRKLDQFFCCFRVIDRINRHYSGNYVRRDPSFRMDGLPITHWTESSSTIQGGGC